ncbi:phage tail protein [Klebsiella michiganensis]|nr:phage tail protein [Klebsiella michiganensis]
MNKINFSQGQAAGTSVSEPNADATLSVASGGASTFAGLVVSRRGAPGKVLQVTDANYKSVLGNAIHPRLGKTFEPMRHVARAVKGGSGYVVRVCPSDMKIPGLAITVTAAAPVKATKSSKVQSAPGVVVEPAMAEVTLGDTFAVRAAAPTTTSKATTFAPLTKPTLPEGATFMVYIKDGDASANRSLTIEPEEDSELLNLTLSETQIDGSVEVLETHQFSFNPEATNDMGSAAWLETILDKSSTRLGAVMSADADVKARGMTLAKTAFTGGSDGTASKITSAEYLKALTVLEGSPVNYTAVLSLGCYEPTVIAALNQLALSVRVDMFYDLEGNQTPEDAMDEAKSHSLSSYHQACRYYFPYTCTDPFTSMNVVYGISCEAFIAKAKGVALVSDVGGWHYSPAGTSRGVIDRQNIKPIDGLGLVDKEAFVTARINPVTVSAEGAVFIDDALTTFAKNNYLRFQHVCSLTDAISRSFYAMAQALKHEPDGVTQEGLMKGMTGLLDRFYATGALVKPRDTSQGAEPFIVTVTQLEIDLWQVEWAICPVGVARRIAGKPILMR